VTTFQDITLLQRGEAVRGVKWTEDIIEGGGENGVSREFWPGY